MCSDRGLEAPSSTTSYLPIASGAVAAVPLTLVAQEGFKRFQGAEEESVRPYKDDASDDGKQWLAAARAGAGLV